MTKLEREVIRCARLVASWKPEVYTAHTGMAAYELHKLREVVEAQLVEERIIEDDSR